MTKAVYLSHWVEIVDEYGINMREWYYKGSRRSLYWADLNFIERYLIGMDAVE